MYSQRERITADTHLRETACDEIISLQDSDKALPRCLLLQLAFLPPWLHSPSELEVLLGVHLPQFGFPGRPSLRQGFACRVFIWDTVPRSRSGWRGKRIRDGEIDTLLKLPPMPTGFISLILPGPLRILEIPGLSQHHPSDKWNGWSLIHKLPIPHGLRVCPRECQLSYV